MKRKSRIHTLLTMRIAILRGFTLIEVLLVVTLISLLLLFVFISLKGQSAKAYDAKRKTDLYNMQKALEGYRNDKEIYPEVSLLAACGSDSLSSYNIKKLPCDPVTNRPYYYAQVGEGYRLCTKLANTSDPSIKAAGCDSANGCGVGGGYNYCVAVGTTPASSGTVTAPTQGTSGGSYTPTLSGGMFACSPPDSGGVSHCNKYTDPIGAGCPVYFLDRNCENRCGNSATWCSQ